MTSSSIPPFISSSPLPISSSPPPTRTAETSRAPSPGSSKESQSAPTTPDPKQSDATQVDPVMIAALNHYNDSQEDSVELDFPNPYDFLAPPSTHPYAVQGYVHSSPDLSGHTGSDEQLEFPKRLPSILRPAHPRSFDSAGSRRASMALSGFGFGPSHFVSEDGRLGVHSVRSDQEVPATRRGERSSIYDQGEPTLRQSDRPHTMFDQSFQVMQPYSERPHSMFDQTQSDRPYSPMLDQPIVPHRRSSPLARPSLQHSQYSASVDELYVHEEEPQIEVSDRIEAPQHGSSSDEQPAMSKPQFPAPGADIKSKKNPRWKFWSRRSH